MPINTSRWCLRAVKLFVEPIQFAWCSAATKSGQLKDNEIIWMIDFRNGRKNIYNAAASLRRANKP